MPITCRHEFVREMIDRLGIPKHSRSFSIHFRYDDVVTVDVEYLPTPSVPDEAGFPAVEKKRYRLEEIK